MKKNRAFGAVMLVLCVAPLVVNIGSVMGFATGFTQTEYFATEAITVDGKWTTVAEWSAGEVKRMGTPQKGLFVYLMDSSGAYSPSILVEFADSTNNPGDIIQVCMNGGTDSSAPRAAEDYKMEIQGRTTKKVYTGTGSGWVESPSSAAAVQTALTITTSAHDPANHVVAEFKIDKGTLASWGASPPPEGLRVACYDASTGQWTAWPPTSSADNPSTWGLIDTYSMTAAPEGLTIGVMLLVSCIAVAVSVRYFRKPPKL